MSARMRFLALLIGLAVLSACQTRPLMPAVSSTPTSLPSATHLPSSTPTPSQTPVPTLPPEPSGCLAPPDDYEILQMNGHLFNARTWWMLQHAAELYGGELEITSWAITQGSYHDNGPASFGTHLGGGAVDLSVYRTNTYTVVWDDIPRLLQALRTAGFAAWLREPDEVHDDSPIHIHAIAIGDRDLSPQARAQLDGPAGYFRGYSGLPFPPGGQPTADRYGGPVLCRWMEALGYEDLRQMTPTP